MAKSATAATLAGRLDKLYEFEREPVSSGHLKSGRYFAACFAGEHVAATEFVIGAMFAKYGVAAHDLIYGLIVGNLLAMLSWAFICAPIATQVRLTLYWYLRRIAGPGLTVIYSVVNGILFCILAGAMIAISASAISIGVNALSDALHLGFHVQHPSLNDRMPGSVGWVVTVLIAGTVVISLAIMGFKRLSQFSAVCAPWLFVIFIAGALATLPGLGQVRDWDGFWRVAESGIWNGVPEAGQTKLGFWHIVFFAWFCNLATHIGLTDMALFRYARSWTYGFYSAFGMFLGHYLSWICAGIMGAAVVGLNPGEMSVRAAGVAGAIAVLLAGWTTANPTMYRAGLALQIATPNWPRWKVTLAAGAVTTLLACFPVFFMRLLDFVAIYGLTLMPIGAIVVVEHWLFPWLGLCRYWTEQHRKSVNLPALIAWIVTLAVCFPIEDLTGGRLQSPMAVLGVHLFYRWLPGWFIAAALYILLARFMGAAASSITVTPTTAVHAGEPQRGASPESTPEVGVLAWAAGGVALLALAACLVLPIRVFLGGGGNAEAYAANLEGYKRGLLIASMIYFVAGTIWQVAREKTRAISQS